MLLLIVFIVFITSLFIGSFFNVLIDRIIRNEQFIKGRSYCESCKHVLTEKDLIPVFSYLLLKGRCRYCQKKIPAMLPITEITVALTFTTITYWYLFSSSFAQNSMQFSLSGLIFLIFLFLLFSFLLLIFFTDLKYKLIPDIYVIGMFVLYLAVLAVYYIFGLQFFDYEEIFITPLPSHIAAAMIMFLFFGALYYFSKGKALGEGDIYLSAVLGLLLGIKLTIVMWFAAFITGASIGIAIMLLQKKSMKYAVPFGPFLIIGFVVALLFGNQIMNWYLSFLVG